MSISESTLTYGPGGKYSGYSAFVDRNVTNLPAVIVLQEIWGVDEHIKDVTRRFAKAGYFAFAPDLYSAGGKREPVFERDRIEAVKSFLNTLPAPSWHDQEKLVEALSDYPKDQAQQIQETLGRLFSGNKPENYAVQLIESVEFLRVERSLTRGQPLGSVGFCMGGGLSAILAGSGAKVDAAVIFYGRPPDEQVIRSIGCPVLGFYGETDAGITPKIPELAAAMKGAGKKFEYFIFKGAGHAFFNDTRASYNPDAARQSFARTLEFFSAALSRNTGM
ncbi:MAG TPA: dienelactone hydrolase family protein [Spirochaetia bacterium]|nr:dienelactone hydrolase family protein [Spirochaetia bacterium]